MPADAPPTTLLAAQRRLAMAGIGSARLGAGSILLSDIAEMVAHHVRGFDHEAEAAKVEEHGEKAAAAWLQFRPAALPAAEAARYKQIIAPVEKELQPGGNVYHVHQ